MARRIVAEFDAVTGPFLRKLQRIDTSVRRFERGTLRGFRRVERGMNTLVASASRLRAITGLLATGFGINLAAKFVDQAKLIRNALREAGDESQETFDAVFRSSVRALSGFRDVAKGVQRFQKALGDRQGIASSIRQIETLNKLLALGGKTAQERSSTLIQFSQALQAGYLGGEELRAIRENAPIELTRAIAREAGGTIQDLKDLATQGLLTTDVMVAALVSLEKEADRRFGKIQVTVQDAAKIFASGAIIAVESFDEALGLSRTTVSGLKLLGETLGQSAEAFNIFGKAIKVAGVVLLTSFAGRRFQRITSSFKALKTARLADVAATRLQVAAAEQEVVAAGLRQASAARTFTQLQAGTIAKARGTKVSNALTVANTRLAAANRTLALSTTAATSAQIRLSAASRAGVGSVRVLAGTVAFLGGLPGIILLAAGAFFLMAKKAENAAKIIARIVESISNVKAATDNLLDVQSRLNDAIEEQGNVQTVSSQKSIRALETEFRVKQQLLGKENTLLFQSLAELQVKAAQARSRAAGAKSLITPELLALERGGNADAIRSLQAVRRIVDVNTEAALAYEEAIRSLNIAILETRDLLNIEGPETGITTLITKEQAEQIKQAEKLVTRFVKSQASAAHTERAIIAGLVEAREILLLKYEEEHEVIVALDVALDRYKLAMLQAKNETLAAAAVFNDLTSSALALDQALDAISDVELSLESQVAIAENKLRAAQAGATQTEVAAIGKAQEVFARFNTLGKNLTAESAGAIIKVAEETAELEARLNSAESAMARLFDPKGAIKAAKDLRKDALSFIEAQLTLEEDNARQLKEILNIRRQIVATYPDELEFIRALDEAIERFREDIDTVRIAQEELWNSISDNIAQAIDEGKTFRDLLRAIAADLVRQHGVNFFTSLLTPGTQKGTDFGTTAGNFVASLFHKGGKVGDPGAKRAISPFAFAGAKRFHGGGFPGLASNEVATILQKGETVLPKDFGGGGSAGGGLTIVNHNDFRGVDPSMQDFLRQQLAIRDASFEARFVQAGRKMNRARIRI